MRILIILTLLTALKGCAARNVHVQAKEPVGFDDFSYLDLQVGWRLRVVTPILKSGGYLLHSLDKQSNDDLTHLSAGPDFIGYETSYYAVKKHGTDLRIDFTSAETVIDGKMNKQLVPLARLFEFPLGMRYARIIYLVRKSDADHNVALLYAADTEALAISTLNLQAAPDMGCKQGVGSFCSWVPQGISVQPQEQRVIHGEKKWDATH